MLVKIDSWSWDPSSQNKDITMWMAETWADCPANFQDAVVYWDRDCPNIVPERIIIIHCANNKAPFIVKSGCYDIFCMRIYVRVQRNPEDNDDYYVDWMPEESKWVKERTPATRYNSI